MTVFLPAWLVSHIAIFVALWQRDQAAHARSISGRASRQRNASIDADKSVEGSERGDCVAYESFLCSAANLGRTHITARRSELASEDIELSRQLTEALAETASRTTTPGAKRGYTAVALANST
jgi:hypothetical protein